MMNRSVTVLHIVSVFTGAADSDGNPLGEFAGHLLIDTAWLLGQEGTVWKGSGLVRGR